MKDILLVEDQKDLAGLVQIFLEREGFTVLRAETGEQAMEYLKEQPVKLLLLDIMLPGMDGFAVCRAVREKWNLPVLIMSARTGRDDKLSGYELGADDYMEKPVDPEILTAKVRALLQRTYGVRAESSILSSGKISIDTASRQVYINGKELELNGKEYELLLLFVKNPGKTLLKDYIFAQIWGMDSLSENQTLTVHIKMLRGKIEENQREPKRILTVWGVGYRYEEI